MIEFFTSTAERFTKDKRQVLIEVSILQDAKLYVWKFWTLRDFIIMQDKLLHVQRCETKMCKIWRKIVCRLLYFNSESDSSFSGLYLPVYK